jgi:hypothetical protein
MNMRKSKAMHAAVPWLWAVLALAGGGCLSIKSEHEVKPIHITMDINLKVDRELDRYFGDAAGEAQP